jgi:hypothetical protein
MTEDTAIAIDRTTLHSVYTCTQPGMAPGRCTADRAHPTVRTLDSYGPILHPTLKATPSQRELHRNCEMPPSGHTGDTLREGGLSPPVVSLHLSPTDTLYPAGRYGSTLAELNSALTPRSAGWCVRKSHRQVDSLGFRPGQAHILQVQVKPQHIGSENRHSRDTLRSAPLSPIPDRLSRAHPRQSTKKRLLLPAFTPLMPRTTIPIPTHASRSSAYIHTYKHI